MEDFTIEFLAGDEYAHHVGLPPSPASEHIPKWWRDMEASYGNPKEGTVQSNYIGEQNMSYPKVTAKKCFPMLDAITSGYILPLWADVEVTIDDKGEPLLKWLTDRPVLGEWPAHISKGVENPNDCYPIAFKLVNQYIIKTPPGWSCLFTQPIGYPNLPIRTSTGLVDTDTLQTEIAQPFWLKKGFTGIIPKGTPIAQIIPIKRQNWKAEVGQLDENELYFNTQKTLRTSIVSAYGHNLRQKKNYK